MISPKGFMNAVVVVEDDSYGVFRGFLSDFSMFLNLFYFMLR
ncbi:hypothetical protein HanPI659440_Chr14g0569191 [Helianthus annuus]|nr:hypothetical protein HanPI659440_Chr14g0569191 [Helianthus annuus]